MGLTTTETALLFGLALADPSAVQEAIVPGALHVAIDGIRSRSGEVVVSAHTDTATYRARDAGVAQARTPASGDLVQLTLTGIPDGPVALLAYHDENGNGELDYDEHGRPLEPVAYSGEPRRRGKPPRFRDALVELTQRTVHLSLRHREAPGSNKEKPE